MKRLIAMLALTVPALAMAQVTSNANSSAQTASQSSAANQGNAQNITFANEAPSDHSSAKVYSNPTVYAPSMSSGFSPMNCANSVSGGASGALIGLSLGGPKESLWCNGRADATILMQMSNAVRQLDPSLATRLVAAATGTMCKQTDATSHAMAAQGLCSAPSPITAAPGVKVGQVSRSDLVAMYSGQ